jgi:hypothetical protein
MATSGIMKPVGKRQRQRQVAKVIRDTILVSQIIPQHEHTRMACDRTFIASTSSQPLSILDKDMQDIADAPDISLQSIDLQHSLHSAHSPTLTLNDSESDDDNDRDDSASCNNFCSDCREFRCICRDQSMQNNLRSWAVKHGITQAALNDLLGILKPDYPSLPQDSRTLKRGGRSREIVEACGGEYLHLSLVEQLCRNISCGLQLTDVGTPATALTLAFNIDGLPLFKSSLKQF